MQKKITYLLFFLIGHFSFAQECPTLISPANGAQNIPVDATLMWPKVDGISAFVISLGTTPNGVDILNRSTSGPIDSYLPELGLPENTQIYVSMILIVSGGPAIVCPPQTFKTVDVTTPPPCTNLNFPANSETNVSTDTEISWDYASTATGYQLSIGTTQGGTEILDNVDKGNVLSYNPPEELPLNSQIYIQIVPYNENGDSAPCNSESFTTGIISNICEPYFDNTMGNYVKIKPEINFPDQVGICENAQTTLIASNDMADGYRWFKVNEDNTEILLSDTMEVPISELGRYRYEAYNNISQSGSIIECADSKEFSVVASSIANITSINVTGPSIKRQIMAQVNGSGNYEFSLDNIDGPYQDSNLFENISEGYHIVYVRDKNGCGIAQGIAERDLKLDDFPKFFTPNGDNINDYWQFIPPKERGEIEIDHILIYDRYGNFLVQIDPFSEGWDGNFKGSPLPSSDYWFMAKSSLNENMTGHFSLKR